MAEMMVKFALLLLGLAATKEVAARGGSCRPAGKDIDCSKGPLDGWFTSQTMLYRLFPEPKTMREASDSCKDYAEQYCKDSRRYQSTLVSYLTKNEWELSIMAAYDEACIQNGPLFWSGVERISGSKLYYINSRPRTSRYHEFAKLPRSGDHCVVFNRDTGKMQVEDCKKKHPYMCKIFPRSH